MFLNRKFFMIALFSMISILSSIIISAAVQKSEICANNILCSNLFMNQISGNVLDMLGLRHDEVEKIFVTFQDLAIAEELIQNEQPKDIRQRINTRRSKLRYVIPQRKGKGKKFCKNFDYASHRESIAEEKNSKNVMFAIKNRPKNYNSLAKEQKKEVEKKLRKCNNKSARAEVLSKHLERECKKKIIIVDKNQEHDKVNKCAYDVREKYEKMTVNATNLIDE